MLFIKFRLILFDHIKIVLIQKYIPRKSYNNRWIISAPQSKNAVSTYIKHSRYIHFMSNFLSNHFHAKKLYEHMFDIVDTRYSL